MSSKSSYRKCGLFALAVLVHIVAFLVLSKFIVFASSGPPERTSDFILVAAPKPVEPPPPLAPSDGNQFSVPVADAPTSPPAVITMPVPNMTFNAPKVRLPDFTTLLTKVVSLPVSGGGDSENSAPNQGQGAGTGRGSGLGNGLGVQMDGLLFALPCGRDRICPPTSDSHVYLKLTDSAIHVCTLRVRGLVEQATYRGGTVNGYLYSGGIPDTGTFNVYELAVNDPPQTYYLNAGKSYIYSLFALDYTFDIQIHDDSKITLHADTIDGKEVDNRSRISIPDIDPRHPIAVKQPYSGQFIQIDAISIK